MRMEASETLLSSSNQTSSKEEILEPVVVQADVDLGTSSTVDPTVSSAFRQDASVTSGMTDPASVDGNEGNLGIIAPGPDGSVGLVDPDVPKQVIVADEATGTSIAADVSLTPPVEEQAPLVVTSTPPLASETVSLSALPDPPTGVKLEIPASYERSATQGTVRPRSASPAPQDVAASKDDSLDDYIRSPEIQNAIVERSPGSRYVRFTEKLGSGASKDVFRAYDTQEGIEVAWNVVNLSGVPKTERNRIVNEVRLLERLHHHNIISFHGSWVNRERQEVNFVTEILSSGTLKSFINKVQVIRWKIAKRWAFQILNGLAYLHSQDPPVIHRDLKCENIFINGTSGDLRIGDLGLSTVHRNGRVLSVLGTPEFMAPDMYEESSYDHKVDIYAFGLCMLEIFTKEIPYSECKNPAQIYKKVSSGAPPSVLMRLQSHHAREFVLLCLGYKDENGNYIRPTASELLKHPFLEKRENDDDEVGVDRPLSERVIFEEESSISPSGTRNRYPIGESSSNRAPPIRQIQTNNSMDEDGDRFDEMPESEVNMRKVKVLMGRGQELEEEDPKPKVAESVRSVDENSGVPERPPEPVAHVNPSITGPSPGLLGQESVNVRPYADDVLKLVVTLPVDGQTQNVQFDFHLVKDDPVQVGKEMVSELGIPQGAVLEISETISGLACAARMKQDKHAVRMQNTQGKMLVQQQQAQNQGPAQDMRQNPSQAVTANPTPDYVVSVHHAQESALHDQQQGQMHPQQGTQPSMYVQPHAQPYGYAPVSYENSYENQLYHQSQHPQVSVQQQQAYAPDQSQHPQVSVQQQQAYAPDPSAPPPPPQQQQMPLHSQVPMQQQQHQQQAYAPDPVATPPTLPQHQVSLHSQVPVQQHQQQAYAPDPSAPLPPPQQQMPLHSQVPFRQQQQAYAPGSVATLPQSQSQHGQGVAQQQHDAYAPGTTVPPPPPPQQQSHHAHAPVQQPQQAYVHSSSPQQQQPQHFPAPVQQQQQQAYAPGPGSLPPSPRQPSQHSQAPVQQQQQVYTPGPGAPPPPPYHQVHQQPPQAQTQQHVYAQSPAPSPSPPKQIHRPLLGNQIPQPDYSAGQSPTVNQAAGGGHAVPAPSHGVAPAPPAPSSAFVVSAPLQMQPRPETSKTAVQVQAVEENRINPPLPRNSDPELSTAAPAQLKQRRSTTGSSESSNNEKRQPLNGKSNSFDADDFGESSDEVNAEIRKIDEDFQKNLLRAKKVFDSRMDSLQRSQVEREVQHQKTLERHGKERADFEKRLAQENDQQSRRIQQLQSEWDRRRESLAQHKRNPQTASVASSNSPDSLDASFVEGSMPNPNHHIRSVSSISNYTVSPAMTAHKQPSPAMTGHKQPDDESER